MREMLYDAELLQDDFKLGEISYLEELKVILDEGKYHSGEAAIVRAIVERKT